MTDSSMIHLVGIAVPTLRQLRSAVLGSSSPESAVTVLREAGFAGGDAVHAAFEQWIAELADDARWGETSAAAPLLSADLGDLSLDEFGERTTEFFRAAGWGDVTFSHDDSEGLAFIDIVNCWEGASHNGSPAPGCHVTTGLLAAFFGRIAGYPVAVLETECCEGAQSRCRFLMGNPDIMNYKWEELQ